MRDQVLTYIRTLKHQRIFRGFATGDIADSVMRCTAKTVRLQMTEVSVKVVLMEVSSRSSGHSS